MKPKKRNPQSSVRRAASITFVKSILSEVYTPRQVSMVKFDTRVDFGMDSEVLELFEKIVKRFGKLKRDIFEFEVFKLVALYCIAPDIRGILGSIQFPDTEPSNRKELSKLEKIRNEIYEYQTRQRPPTEPHMVKILDFIHEKVVESHRFLEIVEYKKDLCKLESVIDKLCDAAPKKEINGGHPGVQYRAVFVRHLTWPDRGYVISENLFEIFPELEGFFRSKTGVAFYKCYMQYVANQFPNMQEKILDHVNAFTNQYFQWMVTMLSFPDNVPAEVRWKYAPMESAHNPTSSPNQAEKLLLRIIMFKENGRLRRKFVFLHEVRVILEKLKNLNIQFIGGAPIALLREGSPPPLVHEYAEFTSAEYVMVMLREITPEIDDYVEIVESELHSLSLIDKKCLPIVSPYNTHCIPAIQGFERIVEILVFEVQIGRRIPLNFRCLEVLIKKMEQLFAGSQIFKTMVDRKTVHDLMREATDLMEKFNGKLKNPSGKLGEINGNSTEEEKIEAFVDTFQQFASIVSRHKVLPIPDDCQQTTPPGEPEVYLIQSHICHTAHEKTYI